MSAFPPAPNLSCCQSRGAWSWFFFASFPGLFWFPREKGGRREGKAGWDLCGFLAPIKSRGGGGKVDNFCSRGLKAGGEEATPQRGEWRVTWFGFRREGGGARRATGAGLPGPREPPPPPQIRPLTLLTGTGRKWNQPQRKEKGK